LARRRKSKRALSRSRRAVLTSICLIGAALLVWLDRAVISPQWPSPATSQEQPVGTDLAAYHGRTFAVVKVVDGDTLHLAAAQPGGKTTKVRLRGIDAPEMGTNREKRMYFAEEATEFVRRRTRGQSVSVYLDEGAESRDRYGRLLAYIELPDGRFLNEELLSEGLVYADRRFRHSYFQKYLQLEAAARSQGRGLWKDVTREKMPPWLQKRSDAPSRR